MSRLSDWRRGYTESDIESAADKIARGKPETVIYTSAAETRAIRGENINFDVKRYGYLSDDLWYPGG